MLRKDSSFPKTEEESKSDEKSFKRNKNLAINAKKKRLRNTDTEEKEE